MPFIGKQPQAGAYSKLDSITTSATATYNLTLSGSAYYPSSANHLLVSLNGVLQAPQDSFTVSGSQITFASALTSADSIDFIMALGDVLDIGTPSAGATVPGDFNVNGEFKTTGAGAAKITLESLGSNNQGGIVFDGNHVTDGNFITRISAKGDGDVWYEVDPDSNLSSANSKHQFYYQGTEYLRLGTSGISFDGGSNHLDDYEEGTHQPTITCGNSGTITLLSTGNTLNYTKIGNLVHVSGLLRADSVSSPNGTISISLPFTNINALNVEEDVPVNLAFNSVSSGNVNDFWGQVTDGSSNIVIYYSDASAVTSDSAQKVQAGTSIRISAIYKTDS